MKVTERDSDMKVVLAKETCTYEVWVRALENKSAQVCVTRRFRFKGWGFRL